MLQKHIFEPYQPDVFMMAWMDNTGRHLDPRITENPHGHPGYDLASPKVDPEYARWVVDTIKPIDMHLDHYYLHDDRFSRMVENLSRFHHPWPHHRPKGTMSLNWSRSVVMRMKSRWESSQGWKYDRVICTRWDIMHSCPINLDDLDPTVVSLPNVHGPEVTSDVWAFGPSHHLDAWGEQFDHIQELVDAGSFNLGTHEWMKAWFLHRDIPWQNRDDLGLWTVR